MSELPIMFRVDKRGEFKGTVTAIFPTERYAPGALDVMAYAHIGQHGAASWAWVYADTRPATPEEYTELLRELTQIYEGVTLRVYKRRPRTA